MRGDPKRVVIVSILWFSARMVESDRRIVLVTIRIRRAIESTKNLVNGQAAISA